MPGPLTRRGWALVSGSLALAALGRVLGVLELFVLAAGGLGLVGVAVVTVLLRRRTELEGTRRLVPARVHAGNDSRVELIVANRGSRTSPVVTMRDSVVQVRAIGGGTPSPPRQARFHVAPLAPGQSNRAAYRLGAERRGLFRVGPLETVIGEPFGLVSTTTLAAPETELTVYPRVDLVTPPPMTTGHDPRSGGGHPTFLGSGDEFYGLREYEVGDDLRRVHWPSTARQDDLMIRQHEVPWQGRATVLLDVRAAVHTDASLEDAVSAAASLVNASWKRDSEVRLLTTDGLDSGFGSGPAHLSAVMEHLAVLEAGTGRLDSLVGSLRQRATGALVLVTTAAAENGTDGNPGSVPERNGGSLQRLLVTRGGYGWAAVVLFGSDASDPSAPSRSPAGLTVPVEPGRPFADAWNSALVASPLAGGSRPAAGKARS
ncbi:MAG: DUF58 domain-containing protein [Acidimicrobiales bacterium]|nr:DUF58 domain-containing protein [Actinomycetota bacterium]